MVKRLTLAVLFLSAIAVGGALLWGIGPLRGGAQTEERTVVIKPPPSCAESIAQLGLEGQEVHCVEPLPPNYDAPTLYGPYRLVPPGYVGVLTYQDTAPATIPRGVVTTNPDSARSSSLYREPSHLPSGYALASVDTGDTHSESVIHLVYTGPGRPIEVSRVRRYTTPIDVFLAPPEAERAVETTMLGGKPAILSYPVPGSAIADVLFTRVSFVDGAVETTVTANGLGLDSAVQIALSLR
jgi:hypothetical protein